MFCKSTSLFFLTLLSVFSVTSAHAGVSPALGVAGGTLKRSDVKRPSKANPCGQGVNIASVLDTSTAVPAGGNGEVPVTAINFNPGGDGSRKVSAKVDSKGSGTNFVVMDVTVNGDASPKEKTSPQNIVAQLPAGTTCTGGTTQNKCLVQFVTTAGFGNCVVVSQGSGVSSPTTPAPAAASGVEKNRAASVRVTIPRAEVAATKEKKNVTKDKKTAAKKEKKAAAKKEKNNKNNKKSSAAKKVAAVKTSAEKKKNQGAGKEKGKKAAASKKKVAASVKEPKKEATSGKKLKKQKKASAKSKKEKK